ncbi:potassium channel protein [Gorillibacterium timonense]|uniref:potassium channel protein n=1 Tax=Gorillibacterium timonense TaxID=1689269 RepID=UPI001F184BC5|nr:potassium channel family protein [Gorillibacterium timonense]
MLRVSKKHLGILIVSFVLVSASLAYLLEPDTFGNWFNAFYWVLTTMATVGYGDYFAHSAVGKGFTIFLYIFGIGLLSLVIGKVIDGFGSVHRQRRAGELTFRGKDHIIIINWNRKAQAAVEEIAAYQADLPIVLIDESGQHPMEQLPGVHFVKGDPSDDEVLIKAGITNAKAAIVFADLRIDETSLADGKTLLIVSSIERIAPKVHTTVEILLEKNIQNFRHVQVNEFILSHDAISRLAVRAALQEGNAEVLQQLISRQHGDDLYEVPADPAWSTYADAFHGFLQQGATLLSDRGDLSINRKLGERIPAEARLYVVADEDTYRRIVGGRRTGS